MIVRGKRGDVVFIRRGEKAWIVRGLKYDKLVRGIEKYKLNPNGVEERILRNVTVVKDAEKYRIVSLQNPIVLLVDRVDESAASENLYKDVVIRKRIVLNPDGSISEEIERNVYCYFKDTDDSKYYRVEIRDPCANIANPVDYLDCLKRHGYSLWKPPVRLTLYPEIAEEARRLGCSNIKRVIDGPEYDYLSHLPSPVIDYFNKKLHVGRPDVLRDLSTVGAGSIRIEFDEDWSDCPSPECHVTIVRAEVDGRGTELFFTGTVLLGYRGDKSLAKTLVEMIRINSGEDSRDVNVEEEVRKLVEFVLEDLDRVSMGRPPLNLGYIFGVKYKVEKRRVRRCYSTPYPYNSEYECDYETETVLPSDERERLIDVLHEILHGLALIS